MMNTHAQHLTAYQVLFVEDSSQDVQFFINLLQSKLDVIFEYEHVMTRPDLEDVLHRQSWDLVLCDFFMPMLTASEAIQLVKSIQPQTPIILISGTASVQDAVDMMRLGARAYVEKSDLTRLIEIVREELEISELRQKKASADTELKAYRTHLDAILNTMQDALLSITLPEREVIFVSRAFEQIMGYPHDRFIEDISFLKKVVHPDDFDYVIEAMQTCLIEGDMEIDHRIILPDGQVRWVNRRAWVNYDEDGQPIRVNDSASDITERKQVEEKAQYQASLLQQVSDAIIATDKDMKITAWNNASMEIYGWTEDEAIGQHIDELCQTEWHDESQASAQATLLENGYWRGEIRQHDRAGKQLNVLASVSLLYDKQGEPIGGVTINHDITARKQVEEKAQYQANLLQQVSDAIITIDTDRKITTWNKAATEIYGWTESEVIGQCVEDLLKTEWITDSLPQALAQYTQTGHWHGELREIDKSGNTHYIAGSVNATIDEQGRPTGGVIINRDITEHKQVEMALKESEQRLQLFIDYAPAAIAMFDMDMRYLAFSHRYLIDYRLNEKLSPPVI